MFKPFLFGLLINILLVMGCTSNKPIKANTPTSSPVYIYVEPYPIPPPSVFYYWGPPPIYPSWDRCYQPYLFAPHGPIYHHRLKR